jgi:hypothetical protein
MEAWLLYRAMKLLPRTAEIKKDPVAETLY